MKRAATIRAKLISAVILLVMLPSLTLTYSFYKSLSELERKSADDTLQVTSRAYHNAIEALTSKGLNYAEFLSSDRALQEAALSDIGDGDNTRLLKLLSGYYERLDVSNIEYTSPAGIVRARGHLPEKFNDSKRGSPFTDHMLENRKKGWGYEIGKGGITLKFGAPLFFEDKFIGFVGYGYYIDLGFLESIKRLVQAELMFVLRDEKKLIATTHEELTMESINSTFLERSLEGEKLPELARTIGDRIYSGLYVPIQDADSRIFASICLFKNITQEVENHNADLLTSLFIILGTALLAVLTGILLTGSISKRIRLAADLSDRLSEGELDLDISGQAEIKDEIGQLFAAMQHLSDKLNEISKEINTLIQAVQKGKLNIRGNTEIFTGGWKELVSGLNSVVDAFISPFNVTAENLDRLARGDIPQKITETYQGDFMGVIENLNQCIGVIGSLRNETAMLTEAAMHGRLNVRGDTTPFSGDYAAFLRGINNVITTLVGHIDRIPLPIHIIGQDFTIRYINRAGAALLRQTPEQILNRKCYDLFRTSDCRTEQCACARAMHGKITEHGDTEARPGDQNLLVSYTGIPLIGQDGAIIGALEIFQDQTDVKEAFSSVREQSQLRAGQAELSTLMRGEQEVRVLAKNVIGFLTKHIGAQVGALYLLHEQNGDTVLRLAGSYAYLRRKGARNEFRLGESMVGQAALEKESIHYTKIPRDYIASGSGLGENTPRHLFIMPFLYEGRVKGVIEIGSVREFSEGQLDLIKQAAENIAIAFQSVDNRMQMQTLLDATQRQAEELQQQQEELRQTNEELGVQTKHLQASEQRLQQQQEELRQTNEELEQQTRELVKQQEAVEDKNRALQQASELLETRAKDLEIASKYKSEFLANMSHELRTPLNSMLILSNLLAQNKDGNLSGKQVEFARTVHTSGQELLTLINEVLDLSKVEAGKMELNLADMSLQGLGNYIEQHFAHVAQEKGLSMNVEIADDVPVSIYTDRQRIEQIVKNFLSNAFKFTSEGGITLAIRRPATEEQLLQSALDPRRTVALAVSDTGIGIPKEKQRLIFEAFQQADGSTNRKYGGTGLGLSISREMAKLLGGEIQLRSEEGKGSTFTLFLPEATQAPSTTQQKESTAQMPTAEELPAASRPAAETDAEPEREKPQFSEPAAPSGHPPENVDSIRDDRRSIQPGDKSLLIIEDDPKFAAILFDLARERTFKVLLAGDGSAGLQLAYQYLPAAIILDVNLPGTDGWVIKEKLRANPQTEPIPVYMISASDAPPKEKQQDILGYITKPVSPETLDEVFREFEAYAAAGPSGKTLIVEDDKIMRKSLLELLNMHLSEIETASSGKEAFERLKNETFGTLVLDLGLPDMSGFDFLERLSNDNTIAPLHIIVYTGRELSKDENQQLHEYTDSVIIKGAKSADRLLDEMTLLLHKVECELPKEHRPKPKTLRDKDAVLDDKTILVVDDDMRNVYALANVLDDKGLNIVTAENGLQALEALDEQPDEIDLVLMDIMMPEMDGYETTREIRKQARFRKLPIIALTAKAMKGDRQKCLEAGANDYLSKPVDTDKLFSLLRVWLY